jgi:hypothetical protein
MVLYIITWAAELYSRVKQLSALGFRYADGNASADTCSVANRITAV